MNNRKKILSLALSAALILGSGAPIYNNGMANSNALIASAVEEDGLVFGVYKDHAVLVKCGINTAEEISISDNFKGLPVTEISEYAFLGNASLKTVELPKSVTKIGEGAFSMCKHLKTINIPESVTEIGGLAFNNTEWLFDQRSKSPIVSVNKIVIDGSNCTTTAIIPDGTVAISDYAFADCDKLENVTIPKSVTSIGATSFKGTPWEAKTKTNLGELAINGMIVKGGNMPNSSDEAADDILILSEKLSNHAYAEHNDYKTMQLCGELKIVGDSAFCACNNLESFEVCAPVTEIQDHAFEECRSLKTFKFTSSTISEIGSYAFRNCVSLTEISFPESISTIGKDAFYNCPALKKITISNPNCFIYDSSATICSQAVIYGYSGSTAEAYAKKYNQTFVALEPAQVTTPVTTAAPVTTTVSTTTTPAVTTGIKSDTVVITLPNVPEGSKIIVAVLKGDTDGNNKIDSSDASLILKEYARLSTGEKAEFDGDKKSIIDINGDGTVNAKDASAVLEFYSFTSTGGQATLCEHFSFGSSIKGDVNGDGFVELTDLATLRQFISHGVKTEIIKENADMNSDGFIDVTDLSTLSLKLIDCRKDGDANGDGEVDSTDKQIYENYIYGSGEKHIVEKTADLDKNGKVDLTDYVLFCELTLSKNVKGDVNDDGDVNLADLATLKQIVGKQDVEYNEKNADINGDDKVDMTDLSKLSIILVDG